jgi:CheY-like chemotaxis protein
MTLPGGRHQPILLVVEDDPDDQRFVQWALRRSGLSVTMNLAADGEQAIEYLTHAPERLSLILCDVHLPRKSGWEVLQWARGQVHAARLPFLVWTSLPNPEGAQRAHLLGATSYFSKPQTPDGYRRLVGVLGDYLRD